MTSNNAEGGHGKSRPGSSGTTGMGIAPVPPVEEPFRFVERRRLLRPSIDVLARALQRAHDADPVYEVFSVTVVDEGEACLLPEHQQQVKHIVASRAPSVAATAPEAASSEQGQATRPLSSSSPSPFFPGVGRITGERTALVDMGGVPNMDNPERHNVEFDLFQLLEKTTSSSGFRDCFHCLGAFAAAPSLVGQNAEGILSCEVVEEVDSGTTGSSSGSKMKAMSNIQAAAGAASSTTRTTTCPAIYNYGQSESKYTEILQGPDGSRVNALGCVSVPPGHSQKLEIIGRAQPAPYATKDYTTHKLGCLGNFFYAVKKGGHTSMLGQPSPPVSVQDETIAGVRVVSPAGGSRTRILKIEARNRISSNTGLIHSFTGYLRQLLAAFGQEPEAPQAITKSVHPGSALPCVGLGGVVFMKAGYIQGHVMPDFLTEKITSPQMGDRWLRFFLNGAPGNLVMFSTMLSDMMLKPDQAERQATSSVSERGDIKEDFAGLHLRTEHTHFFGHGPATGQGGHYHGDIATEKSVLERSFRGEHSSRQDHEAVATLYKHLAEPNAPVHYVAYFSLADEIIRVNDAVKMMAAREDENQATANHDGAGEKAKANTAGSGRNAAKL
ncbi:unnamed protein product [Amoebophrya sp. A25]|nr:unnamed protein product [Amoebophrya sp. A25]|eukprot:GSA25T00010702001.1